MIRIALACLLGLTACAQTDVPSRAVTELPPEPRPEFSEKNLACLTEAIYFEAGNKGEEGRRAVAHVILNRVASSEFPNTLCGVIRHGQDRDRCQFSYRCDLDYTRFIYPSQKDLATKTANAVLSGPTKDPTDGALFFHADWAKPGRFFKSRVAIGNYGGNIFYL